MAQAAATLAAVAGEVRKAAADAIPALEDAADEAVSASVRRSLAGASDAVAKSLSDACRPVAVQLAGVVQAAGEAEGKLSRAVSAFGWRWAVIAGSAAAGGIAAVLLAAWLTVWWQRDQVEQLAAQKAALIGEVARLRANAKDWAKRGGRAELDKCGDQNRLCVRVDKSAAYGKEGDYFVLRGY